MFAEYLYRKGSSDSEADTPTPQDSFPTARRAVILQRVNSEGLNTVTLTYEERQHINKKSMVCVTVTHNQPRKSLSAQKRAG